MMDERVKNVYEKIYAELFRLILFGCCVSVIIKFAILDMRAVDCIPEYPILVGSPIYMLIRSRMLGVTGVRGTVQNQPAKRSDKLRRTLRPVLVSVLVLSLLVFTAILRNRGEDVNWRNLFEFAIPFVLCYLLVTLGAQKWAEYRQRKLDEKYDDKDEDEK